MQLILKVNLYNPMNCKERRLRILDNIGYHLPPKQPLVKVPAPNGEIA